MSYQELNINSVAVGPTFYAFSHLAQIFLHMVIIKHWYKNFQRGTSSENAITLVGQQILQLMVLKSDTDQTKAD